MIKFLGSGKSARIILVLVCSGIVLVGIANLLNGRLEYRSYRGFYQFVPFTIAIGLLGLFVAFRKESTLTVAKKSDRIRGWPTRKTRDHRKPHKRLKPKAPTY